MSRPQKVALQRCFLFGSEQWGVEDAAPYKCKCRFINKLGVHIVRPNPCRTSSFYTDFTKPLLHRGGSVPGKSTIIETGMNRREAPGKKIE